MFLDHAVIEVSAGRGGEGSVSFRRASYVPLGGPDGGDGGKGGDIVLEVDSQMTTLLDYRYRQKYQAEPGKKGSGSNRSGRSGDDLILRVPPGTVVLDADSREVLAELVEPGDRLVAVAGGRGGRGNARFATATNQAPRYAQPGEEGEERRLELELKLIADVGLVGEPNAGKSTFLAAISAATPKVADYPFTTLTPNLGVVQLSGGRSFVVADIPGIIEGAHEGRGLGHQFLRHIERTRTLALLIPGDDLDPQETYDRLRVELRSYSEDLAEKPFCVVFTKADLLPPEWPSPEVKAPAAWAQFSISSVARQGLEVVLEALWSRARADDAPAEAAADDSWEP